jgi:hypothetical protein
VAHWEEVYTTKLETGVSWYQDDPKLSPDLIIATFAEAGPKKCSNHDVCGYNADSLRAEFGQGFLLVREAGEMHMTP